MAYSPTEEAFLSRLTAVQFPDQPVEPKTAPSVDGMQLAAGQSQMRSDAGNGYGQRPDGTQKGNGWLGPLKAKDGSVMTELTIGVNIDGQETNIPSIVPTLTKQEISHLLDGKPPTDAIVNKAVDHAMERMAKGLSPYADEPNKTGAGAGRGSYAGFDPRLDVANKGAQPEMRAYDPTTRERIASFLQAGFEGLGMDRYKARQNAQTLIGGGSSNLPLDMGLADIVPFLGTALQTEEAVNMGGEAVQSAKQGNYGTAALQAGGAAIGLLPGGVATVKATKAAAKAIKKGTK